MTNSMFKMTDVLGPLKEVFKPQVVSDVDAGYSHTVEIDTVVHNVVHNTAGSAQTSLSFGPGNVVKHARTFKYELPVDRLELPTLYAKGVTTILWAIDNVKQYCANPHDCSLIHAASHFVKPWYSHTKVASNDLMNHVIVKAKVAIKESIFKAAVETVKGKDTKINLVVMADAYTSSLLVYDKNLLGDNFYDLLPDYISDIKIVPIYDIRFIGKAVVACVSNIDSDHVLDNVGVFAYNNINLGHTFIVHSCVFCEFDITND